jgi:hypothetical protein
VLAPQPDSPERQDFEQRNQAAVSEYIRVHAFEAERTMSAIRSRLGDHLLAAKDSAYKDIYADKKVQPDILDPRRLNGSVHNRMVKSWDTWIKGRPDIFGPWVELAELPEADFAAKAAAICAAYAKNADKKLMAPVARAFNKASPKTLRDIADVYNNLWAVELDAAWGEKWRAALLKACAPKADDLGLPIADLAHRSIDRLNAIDKELVLPEADVEALKKALLDEKSPFVFSGKDFISSKLYAHRDVAEGLRRNATNARDMRPSGAAARAWRRRGRSAAGSAQRKANAMGQPTRKQAR